MRCAGCGADFGPGARARAGIAIGVMGDEYLSSYWWCEACHRSSVSASHDRFLGEDSWDVLPPVSQEVGDRAVAPIRACPEPFDKYCDCPSHRALYHGVPA